MPHRGSRALRYAVLASLLLHGLLFVWFPALREVLRRGAEAPPPLVARLMEAPAPAAPEAAPPVEKHKPPAKPGPSPKARPLAKPEPQPPAPAAASASPPPAPPAAEAAVAPQAAAPAAARQGADVPDADALTRFRRQIIEAAIRSKRYPRVALDNNWEGRADVRITFNAEGRRASIAIVRTSGYEALDSQAIDTVTKAFVPVPPSLRGREFALEIPVIYNLKDAQ